jgi:hypothetical protein
MIPLNLNNIFGHGYQEQDLEMFRNAGFIFRAGPASYAGAQQLHFIDFLSGPCLELIEVADPAVYESFTPPGMIPYAPGLNFGVPEGHPGAIQDFERIFAEWEPYLLHENYEGGQEEHQPGWNYLNFKHTVVPGTFTWITEFDQPYPASHPRTTHPNGVQGIAGLVFDLDPEELEDLEKLTAQPVREGVLDQNEMPVYCRGGIELDPPPSGKQFPLTAVLLQGSDPGLFEDLDLNLQKLKVNGQPALRLETPARSWEVIITF